jgi:hypothetical protein
VQVRNSREIWQLGIVFFQQNIVNLRRIYFTHCRKRPGKTFSSKERNGGKDSPKTVAVNVSKICLSRGGTTRGFLNSGLETNALLCESRFEGVQFCTGFDVCY